MAHADRGESTPRTIRHTPGGGHSVDAKELLRSERAQALIKRVAKELKVEAPRNAHARTDADQSHR